MRAITVLSLLLGLAGGHTARALDAGDCDADRKRFVAALAENRANSLRQLDAALAAAGSDDAREQLRVERDAVWHEEENALGIADAVWRDCLRHVGVDPGAR